MLAETFVGPARFEGTCYRAAGWHEAGATTGHRRARRDYYRAGEGLKCLWLKPLRPDAARHLRGPLETLPPECRAAQPVATMGVLPVKLTQLGSPRAATVLAVRSAFAHKKTGQARGETRLSVNSLETGALIRRQWLARGRGHRSVESANHDRRDVIWREDQEHGRNAGAPATSRCSAQPCAACSSAPAR